jgi:hypothetical protein
MAIVVPGQRMVRLGVPGICPDSLGARNLMSTSYDPRIRVMYVPLTDTCIDPYPNGKRSQKTPDPSTDGYFGIIEAIDLQKPQGDVEDPGARTTRQRRSGNGR